MVLEPSQKQLGEKERTLAEEEDTTLLTAIYSLCSQIYWRFGEVAQEIKKPAAKPDNQDLITGTHVMEGEDQLQQIVLWPPQASKTLVVVYIDTTNKDKE